MATIIITEADLARDVQAALAKVREGNEVIIQRDGRDVAVMKAADRPGAISETLAMIKARGGFPVPDPDFAKDVAEGSKWH